MDTVVGLWRYPVKSMIGEELSAAEITAGGLVGDRQFALFDPSTGKVASAKHPRKWGNFFAFRAAYVAPTNPGSEQPTVRMTLPDGTVVTSEEPDVAQTLSRAFGRDVLFRRAHDGMASYSATAEDSSLEGLDRTDATHDWNLAPGTFFDSALVHVLTTASLDRLRELYPQGRFEVQRFRPNIVVASDGVGFVENEWVGRTLAIGDEVVLQVTGRCRRCLMTTLPQGDLPKDSGILRTVAQANDTKVGVYAGVVSGGVVRRGDAVTVS